MALQTDRSGFVLPLVILVLGFLTAGVLAGFARSGAEVQIVDDQAVETAAFGMAEAGLATYMSGGRIAPADTTIVFPGGQARVMATLVKPAEAATDTAIYLIRSVGRIARPAGRPQATRTVAQLAYHIVGSMQVLSSWTSLGGLHRNGAGSITGHDVCTGNSVAGVATPDRMLTGPDNSISGAPQHLPMGTQAQMASLIRIDWPNIAKPVAPAITPDIVVCMPGTAFHDPAYTGCAGWPSNSSFTSSSYWPTILVNGSTPLPGNGRGILIVTGDLTLRGGDQWEGIILVGGMITDNGGGDIQGAVVSGLNVLKGQPVGVSSTVNGTKDYTYNSCAVAAAANGLAKLVPITNTWADNLSTW
ncbi:MAG TPA: hypothetical protein VFZ69_09160 [Longimicrobiales bacterium]